jgi:hypothetical protein
MRNSLDTKVETNYGQPNEASGLNGHAPPSNLKGYGERRHYGIVNRDMVQVQTYHIVLLRFSDRM